MKSKQRDGEGNVNVTNTSTFRRFFLVYIIRMYRLFALLCIDEWRKNGRLKRKNTIFTSTNCLRSLWYICTIVAIFTGGWVEKKGICHSSHLNFNPERSLMIVREKRYIGDIIFSYCKLISCYSETVFWWRWGWVSRRQKKIAIKMFFNAF